MCAALALAAPTDARASIECERVGFSGLFLKVTVDQNEAFVEITVDGDEIKVDEIVGPGPLEPVDCTDGGDVAPPTITTTDEVRIRDVSDGRTDVTVDDPEAFAPGATDAGGDTGPAFPNEIEFEIDLGAAGGDQLRLYGGDTENHYRLGRDGINANVEGSAPDADIFVEGVESYLVDLGEGADGLDASGSAETGKALTRPLTVLAEGGADVIVGGTGPDVLRGEDGNDTLVGEKGNDVLEGGDDRDSISGSGGRDRAVYVRGGQNEVLTISLGTGDNDGGASDGVPGSRDTVTGSVEDIKAASLGPITLSGNSAPNKLIAVTSAGQPGSLLGFGGADTLVGGDGDDLLVGGSDKDSMVGKSGSDEIEAKDGTRDKRIDCGPGGAEQASRDAIDPPAKSC